MPLRVLVVTNMYPSPIAPPHFGIFVARQVEGLRRAGVDVSVEVVAAERGAPDYVLGRRRVARAVRKSGAQLVHVHFGYTALAAFGHGLPTVLTLHGSDLRSERGASLKQRGGAMLTRWVAARAGRVIVQSERMLSELPSAARRRAVVLPNGINQAHFRPMDRGCARARFGIEPSELVLLFVDGAATRNKRRDLAEAAVRVLNEQGFAARLLVAARVPSNEMPLHYAVCDVLLMTSDREGSPMCVKEALACGRPVVSVAVGDVESVLEAEQQGVIVARDPEAIAAGIRASLAVERSGASLLPARLQDHVVIDSLVQLYQGVLEQWHGSGTA